MLEAASRALAPDELVRWHHRMENCADLHEAAAVTTEMCGVPMTDDERRVATEARRSFLLFGNML